MEEGELSICPQHPDEVLINNEKDEWICDACRSKNEHVDKRDKKSSKKDKKHRSRSRKRGKEKSRSRSKKRNTERSRSKKRDRSRSHRTDKHRSRSRKLDGKEKVMSTSRFDYRDNSRTSRGHDFDNKHRSPRTNGNRKRSRSPRRHDDRKRSRSPRRHDDRKRSRSPRRHDDRKRSRSPRRCDDRNKSRSSRRCNDRNKSPIKYDDVLIEKSSDDYRKSRSPNKHYHKRPHTNSEEVIDSKKIRLSQTPVTRKEINVKEHKTVDKRQVESEKEIPNIDQQNEDDEDEDAAIERMRRERRELLIKLQNKGLEIQSSKPAVTVEEEISKLDVKNNISEQIIQNEITESIATNHDNRSDIALENMAKGNCKETKLNIVMFDIFADNCDLTGEQLLPLREVEIDRTIEILQGDGDGYYMPCIGEMLDKRYNVYNRAGQGVYSSVVKVRDKKENNREAAVKILRNNAVMLAAGLNEAKIIKKLNEKDSEDRFHCLRLYRSFYHEKHLCLVFEPLYINLREVIKRFGKDRGLAIKAVRVYAQQLFMALMHLKKCEIIHFDIKPDNILVDESKAKLKLCDFGCATEFNENNNIESYVVSRFYRAPEIILGIKHDYSLDLWSVAVTIFELHTGQIMFPGKTNNEMLNLFMEYKGKFPHKLIKRGFMSYKHFDQNFNFLCQETDKITQKEKVTVKPMKGAAKNISKVLIASNEKVDKEESEAVKYLSDILDKSLELDPLKRMRLEEIMKHPFLK